MKATLDRLIALLVLALLAPLLLAITAAVAWWDGGPVFVRQERVGVHGQKFRTVAFRSTGTRIGPLLRRYSLVDLLQLLNVVGGSMSLVGPRPPLAAEIGGGATVRGVPVVKPGLTGLLAASELKPSCDDAVEPEQRYAENWTPALDVRIIASALRTAMHEDQAA